MQLPKTMSKCFPGGNWILFVFPFVLGISGLDRGLLTFDIMSSLIDVNSGLLAPCDWAKQVTEAVSSALKLKYKAPCLYNNRPLITV